MKNSLRLFTAGLALIASVAAFAQTTGNTTTTPPAGTSRAGASVVVRPVGLVTSVLAVTVLPPGSVVRWVSPSSIVTRGCDTGTGHLKGSPRPVDTPGGSDPSPRHDGDGPFPRHDQLERPPDGARRPSAAHGPRPSHDGTEAP